MHAAAPTDPDWARLRVLVAEDCAVNRLLAEAQLASLGVQPSFAADGAQAVALACEREYDLILMDVEMPVLDGLAATREIRRFEFDRDGRRRVPVIAFTATHLDAFDHLAGQSGMDAVLRKPCAVKELRDCLLRWCAAALARTGPAALPA